MKFLNFIKDKLLFLFFQFLIAFLAYVLLGMFNTGKDAQFLILLSILIVNIVSIVAEYMPRKLYYEDVIDTIDKLEDKYIAFDLIDRGNFEESRIMYYILSRVSNDSIDKIDYYRDRQKEYEEYIERWIHEIKTPIAAAELLCKGSATENDRKILDEIKRIDEYVEQALYYAKSNSLDKDYSIKKLNLGFVIKSAIKKQARQLIALKCVPTFKDIDVNIYGDEKWIEFIISQLISNSIKYRGKETLKIEFYTVEEKNHVKLYIKDNGIGISDYDKKRIFEKGYTGDNTGRNSKSTGMGLYICKSLCEKMNINISVESEKMNGSTFCILFPKDKLTVME